MMFNGHAAIEAPWVMAWYGHTYSFLKSSELCSSVQAVTYVEGHEEDLSAVHYNCKVLR